MAQTPATTPGAVESAPEPPPLLVDRVLRRERLSVAFRLLLALPQFIVVYVLYLVGFLFLVVGWFAALILGRLPEPIAGFLCDVNRYGARVSGYAFLLTDQYPPFRLYAEDYPVRVELAPGRLNRLAVLFRVILLIPAQIVASVLLTGWLVASFFIWLLVLVLGRVPGSLFDANTAVLRYNVRFYAYYWLVTAAYPWGLFGDRPGLPPPQGEPAVAIPAASPTPAAGPAPEPAPVPEPAPGPEATLSDAVFAGPGEGLEPPRTGRRLVLSPGARRLVVLFLVLGVAANVGSGTVGAINAGGTVSSARALTEVVAAHDRLASHSQKYQRDVAACNQELTCVQGADRELAAALEAFTGEVNGVDFPASAKDEAAEVERLGHRFAGALRGLVAASSPEEYIRLAPSAEQIGNSFDQGYQALVNELAS